MSAGDGISGVARAPRPGQNGTRRPCAPSFLKTGSYDANAGGGIADSTGDCARANALADPLRGCEADDVRGTGAARGNDGGGDALRGLARSCEDDELSPGADAGGDPGLPLRTHLSDLPMTLPRLRPPALPSAAPARKAVGGARGWDCEGRRLEGLGERRPSSNWELRFPPEEDECPWEEIPLSCPLDEFPCVDPECSCAEDPGPDSNNPAVIDTPLPFRLALAYGTAGDPGVTRYISDALALGLLPLWPSEEEIPPGPGEGRGPWAPEL